MRVSKGHLEHLVERLNEVTNSPKEYSTVNDETNKRVINIGHYTLSGAYGGWQLQRVVTDGGGVDDIFKVGYVSKRELYNLIDAYLRGINHD